MIFVTLGSQKFPFDRLLRKIDQLVADGIITEEVVAQTGYSTYQPQHFRAIPFMDRETFAAYMENANMVITHGGTGAIIGGVKAGKKVIAVPRLPQYGEHVDDHQLQIVGQFGDMELIQPCNHVEALEEAITIARKKSYRAYESNSHRLLGDIESYLEKKKILVISNMYPSGKFPSYGVFVENFCKGLEYSGIDYRLAVMRRGSNKIEKLLGYLGFYCSAFFKSLFGRFDLVYVHYASHSSPPVLLARKLRKFRLFTNLHGSDAVPETPQHEKMQRYTAASLRQSEKVIVPSPYFAKLVAEKFSVPMEKIAVCASGGVNTQLFYPRPAPQNPVFTLGYVGRISAGKGWDTLVEACALLDCPYRLTVVGDGPERKQMEQLLSEKNIPVTLLPLQPQEKLPEIYSSLDAFVFPTQRAGESLGLVGLEAMACGVPVICSDFAAPADYVQDGFNGFQFQVGDPAALAKAIARCMDTPLRRENILATAQNYRAEQVHETMKNIITR